MKPKSTRERYTETLQVAWYRSIPLSTNSAPSSEFLPQTEPGSLSLATAIAEALAAFEGTDGLETICKVLA